MREPLRKELLSRFKEELAGKLVDFNFSEEKARWICSWQPPDVALTLFVFVQLDSSMDQFTVEIAWSESTEFPFTCMMGRREQGEGRLRLPRLCMRPAEGEFWWDLDPDKASAMGRYRLTAKSPPDAPLEQILPNVRILAADAVDKLEQFGWPVFQEVVRAGGGNLNRM